MGWWRGQVFFLFLFLLALALRLLAFLFLLAGFLLWILLFLSLSFFRSRSLGLCGLRLCPAFWFCVRLYILLAADSAVKGTRARWNCRPDRRRKERRAQEG